MPSLNKCLLIGHCTRDPEIRFTPKGTAVAEIGLAVNRVYSGDDGQKKEEVTFVDVTFWGRQAEIAERYLRKGQPVFVEGRLQLDTWDDKQSGQKRSRLRVVADNLQQLGSREKPQRANIPSSAPTGTSKPHAANYNEEPDDIPY
jgi:single-strand DNA-binding protein